MTALTATVDLPGRGGDIGEQLVASGYYDVLATIVGHATTGDTITFPNILPQGGAKVIAAQVVSPEIDTHGTPTGTCIVGNSDDDNGLIKTANIGKPAQLPANGSPLTLNSFDGALINTTVTNRDVIIEFTAALATSITSGRIRLNLLLEALSA